MSTPEKHPHETTGSASFGPEHKSWQQTLSELEIGVKPQVSSPTHDPCGLYDRVPGISCQNFQLPATGLTPEQRQMALEQLQQYQSAQQKHFLGYQTNQKLDYETDLKPYLNFLCNNLGDPFQNGNFTVNTKWMERAVLDYYAALWNARWPHDPTDPDSYWGYVLTMGSSEGNLYGMWNARDYLAGKFLMEDPAAQVEAQRASQNGEVRAVPRRLLYQQARASEENPNAYTPIAFYSEDTHYSIIKAMRVLEIKTFYELGKERYPNECPLPDADQWPDGWPQEVPSIRQSNGPGAIDIEKLARLVEFFASKGHPILVCFNLGTAFKGAYDDVELAGNTLIPILKKYGLYERQVHYNPNDPSQYDVRHGFWFHVDGALGAAYLPFLEMAYQAGKIAYRGPNFDFRLPFVHSIGMSGHKWIGAPWPCGIYMTKTKFQLRPPDEPEYIGSPDTTFAGSRNGFSAMIFWDYLAKHSYDDQIAKVLYTEEMANYGYKRLLELQEQVGRDLWVERTPLALTMRFKCPSPDLVFKYSLSTETLWVNGEKRDYCHVYMMEHVTPELIDQLIADLSQANAFPDQACHCAAAEIGGAIAPHAKTIAHVPHTGRGFK